MAKFVIPPEKLRRQSNTRSIGVDSSAEIEPLKGTAGQETARKALRYAVEFPGSGQHVFVRGRPGSRRRHLINSVIEELKPEPRQARDFCFVHSFSNPDRPRLIRLKSGQGRQFQQHMLKIGLFVKERLPEILENDPIRSRRESRKVAAEREIRDLLKPFEKKIEAEGLGLIRSQSGPTARLELGIKVMGKPVSLEEFRSMVARKQATEADRRKVNERVERLQPELQGIARKIREVWHQAQQHIDQINVSEAARILGEMSAEVTRQFRAAGVEAFLRDVIDDVLEKRVGHDTRHLADPSVLYSVNVLRSDVGREQASIIAPDLISAGNLFGSVDPAWRSGERAVASFRGIHAGALIEADGGFLILDAEDLIHQPELFRRLIRSLRAEATEILAPTPDWSHAAQSLKPEPVPIDCCVILFGDHEAHRKLEELDKEFSEQFRILADLQDTVPSNEEGIAEICALLAAIIEEQSLIPLDRTGLAATIDHIGRHSGRPGELAIRPGDLAALLRESTFIAGEQDRDIITAADIEQTLKNRRERSSVAWRAHLRRLSDGPEALQTRGKKSGRANITTTMTEAGETFALPAVIDVTLSNGSGEAVFVGEDTDGQEQSIPVARISDLVAKVLRLDSAPRFHFAQQAGIPPSPEDMDAAVLTMTCMALATLANAPMRQEILLAASLDSRNQLVPVRRINARIEAFHDACLVDGLSGQQGIAIARGNIDRVALDADIIKACTNDTFHIHGLDTLNQAIELATGQRAGVWKETEFTSDSVLAMARTNAIKLIG